MQRLIAHDRNDPTPSLATLIAKFLSKIDSGYPRDAGVISCTIANPRNSLRFNTNWSAPPVSTLARSWGPGARQAEGKRAVLSDRERAVLTGQCGKSGR